MTNEVISDRQFYWTFGILYFFVFLFFLYLFSWSMRTHKVVRDMKTDLWKQFDGLRDVMRSSYSGQSEIRDLTSRIDTLQSQLNASLKVRVDALEEKMKAALGTADCN